MKGNRAEAVAAFKHMKIKCLLRPQTEATAQHLLEKSSNNINPFVAVEAEARTRVSTLIAHIAGKLFKEEASRFVLRVHQSKFTNRKCQERGTRVQDLLLAEEPERLEAALSGNKQIKLVVRYAIRSESASHSKDRDDGDLMSSQSNSENGDEEAIEVPEDMSEADLMEMLTEVMSIMLFNKDEQLNRYASSVSEFDLKAKL